MSTHKKSHEMVIWTTDFQNAWEMLNTEKLNYTVQRSSTSEFSTGLTNGQQISGSKILKSTDKHLLNWDSIYTHGFWKQFSLLMFGHTTLPPLSALQFTMLILHWPVKPTNMSTPDNSQHPSNIINFLQVNIGGKIPKPAKAQHSDLYCKL